MRGRETAANDLARRFVLVSLGLTFFALAALMWPSQASAQIACEAPGCRPLCVAGPDPASGQTTPLHLLTLGRTGLGDGTLAVTALNPYEGAIYNSPENRNRECASDLDNDEVWEVKHWCTFHCEHRHYTVVPGGLPQPATAWITATADATSHFLGWTPDSSCGPPSSLARSKYTCVQLMNVDKTVKANFETSPDLTPPDPAPVIAVTGIQRNTVSFAITPADDDTWLGGYEVFLAANQDPLTLRTRVGPSATAFTIQNLLCSTNYTFRIHAYDSQNATPSNEVAAKTNACPKVPPNGYFHVKPPRTTKKKSAFFHWGAKRGGVELSKFQSKCKLDKKRWRKCSRVTGKTVRKLKPGWHTFRVRVGDAQGWDKTPAVWRWRVRR